MSDRMSANMEQAAKIANVATGPTLVATMLLMWLGGAFNSHASQAASEGITLGEVVRQVSEVKTLIREQKNSDAEQDKKIIKLELKDEAQDAAIASLGRAVDAKRPTQ